jgi:hypothetical protein
VWFETKCTHTSSGICRELVVFTAFFFTLFLHLFSNLRMILKCNTDIDCVLFCLSHFVPNPLAFLGPTYV